MMGSFSICALAQAGSTNSQNATPPSSSDRIGASAVWQPPQDFVTKAQLTCGKGAGPASFAECFMNQIAAAGAPAAAVSFTRMLFQQSDGQVGIMTAFKDFGVVDAAQVLYPLRANDNYGLLLVNGEPKILDVDNLQKLDRGPMEANPLYKSMKQTYPQTDIWPGDRSRSMPWPQVEALPGGGTEFIVGYPLINGCHACRRVGAARFAWDFDASGKFLGTKFVSMPAPPRHQRSEPPPLPSPSSQP